MTLLCPLRTVLNSSLVACSSDEIGQTQAQCIVGQPTAGPVVFHKLLPPEVHLSTVLVKLHVFGLSGGSRWYGSGDVS